MRFQKTLVCAMVALGTLAPVASWANGPRPGWSGDIRQFERHDALRWRGGHWQHVSHGGQLGWWWVTGGLWYLYPGPVYPYPDPYRPPVVVIEQPPAPVVVQQAAPVAPPPAPAVWYFCEAANGYYPYVPACPTGWKTVPATPAPAPQ